MSIQPVKSKLWTTLYTFLLSTIESRTNTLKKMKTSREEDSIGKKGGRELCLAQQWRKANIHLVCLSVCLSAWNSPLPYHWFAGRLILGPLKMCLYIQNFIIMGHK